MSDPRVEKIKTEIETAEHIPADKKAELLGILSKIQPAIDQASRTNAEHAQRIADLVGVSAQAAARKDQSPDHLKNTLKELKRATENFEASHPNLVAFITEYTGFLSAMGI